MKIIRVSGKNLASLREEFTVDFQDTVTASLFALVGDTGAGKSTILDAICLALYCKVPRFPDSKKSDSYSLDGGKTVARLYDPANILSRGAQYGFAEVEFLGTGGCHFLARTSITLKEKGKKLEHTLDVFDSCGQLTPWTPQGDSKKDPVTKAVGLSWAQFSKVIILPQGDFRAFLSAKTSDKTEILEKLTNTQVYSKIDECVTKRINSSDGQIGKLKEEASRLAGQIIQDEELNLMREREHKIAEEKAVLAELRSRARSADQFAGQLAVCRKEAQDARDKLDQALKAKEEAEGSFSLADLYGRTVNCRQSFQELEARKREETALGDQLSGLNAKVMDATEKKQQAADRMQQAEETCRRKEAEQKNSKEDLDKAEELEERLAVLGGEVKTKSAQVADCERKSADAGKELAQLADDERRLLDQLEKLNSRHEKNQGFCFLLDDGFERVTNLAQGIRKLRENTKKEQELQETCRRRYENLQAAIEENCGQMAALRKKWHVPDSPEGELFWNRCPEVLTDAQSSAQRLRDSALTMGAPIKVLTEDLAGLSVCRSGIAEKERELAVYDGLSGDPIVKAGEQVRSLDEELRRLKVMLEFSSHALSLRKGDPCPCCGATEHPRIDGLSQEELDTLDSRLRTEADAKKAELEEARAALNKAEEQKRKLENTLNTLRKEADRLKMSLADQCRVLEAIRNGFLEGLEELSRHQGILGEGAMPRELPSWADLAQNIAQAAEILRVFSGSPDPGELCGSQDAENAPDSLARLERVIADGLKETGGVWVSLKNDAGQYAGLRENVRKSREDAGVNEAELKKLDAELARLGDELREQKMAEERLEPGARKLLGQLVDAAGSAFKNEKDRLEKIRTELQNYGREKDKLEKAAALKSQGLQQSRQAKETLDQELQQSRTALVELEKQRYSITQQHRNLFGGLNSRQKRSKLQEAVDGARTQVSGAEKALVSAQKVLEEAEKRLSEQQELVRSAAARTEEALKRHDDQVAECLRANPGLGRSELDEACRISEEAYLKARELAEQIKRDIETSRTRAEGADVQLGRISGEHAKVVARLPAESYDPVSGMIRKEYMDGLRQGEKRLEDESGDISHKLKSDQEKRGELAEHQRKIAVLEAGICGFRSLQDLFKKRKSLMNYAQSINFQCLLENANRYIRAFTSGRYDLFRVSTQQKQDSDDVMSSSMEMLVTDHQGADEARAVGSLSGGEQFCVSLGLALGLSDLVTGNVTVGTMFVDEGFDTLDNSYLDNVLNCMQSAKINRQIGIISHVSAIVDGEMIPQKVHVERDPRNPAASLVRGGCVSGRSFVKSVTI